MSRQNRRERFWTTPKALPRRTEGRMPESTAGMRESDVRTTRLKKPWKAFFNSRLVFFFWLVVFFGPDSYAIDHADCKYEYACKYAENAHQPYEQGRRIFVTIENQGDKQYPDAHQEEWQSFVNWLWQSHFLDSFRGLVRCVWINIIPNA